MKGLRKDFIYSAVITLLVQLSAYFIFGFELFAVISIIYIAYQVAANGTGNVEGVIKMEQRAIGIHRSIDALRQELRDVEARLDVRDY